MSFLPPNTCLTKWLHVSFFPPNTCLTKWSWKDSWTMVEDTVMEPRSGIFKFMVIFCWTKPDWPNSHTGKEDRGVQGSRGAGEVWGSLNLVLHRPAGTHSGGGHTIYHLTLYCAAHLTPSRSNSKACEWNNCSCWDSLFPPFQSQYAIYCWNA